MATYKLRDEDRELAELLENTVPSGFLYPLDQIQKMAKGRRDLFFRVIAPKYGFDPETAVFAGDRENPSWDVEAINVDTDEPDYLVLLGDEERREFVRAAEVLRTECPFTADVVAHLQYYPHCVVRKREDTEG